MDAGATSDRVLEVRDLSIDFVTPRGRVRALRAASLAVPRNRIVGIVGESGSGKTTLISAALNLLPGNAEVTGGAVLFEGRDVLALSEAELRALRGRRISMVFQDPMSALNPVLSIATQMIDVQYREQNDWHADLSIRFRVRDAAPITLRLRNGVLVHSTGAAPDGRDPDVDVTLTEADLRALLGGADLTDLARQGRAEVSGDPGALAELLGYLTDPDPDFAIVTP